MRIFDFILTLLCVPFQVLGEADVYSQRYVISSSIFQTQSIANCNDYLSHNSNNNIYRSSFLPCIVRVNVNT